ncbi:E set domain-containing protein [Hesseltinella vesiculosa]|uniref:E set domain-containing protein n=1 Tax=Hesseltinella vesiculosa TaxID=101127 RepID=A0A1X2GV88_9FUNG|nr:E set domain-containing protein [Hesseltinella vesiculosa]
MPNTQTTKEEPIVRIELDDSFTGILQGEANDESEGCTLSGQVIIDTPRPLRVRRLMVWVEGRCKVHLRKAAGYSMMPTPDSTATRSLFSHYTSLFGQDGQMRVLEAGQHAYYFTFEFPAHLPTSFKGKRGYIRYRLNAMLYRPILSRDIHIAQEIILKRCLMSDLQSDAALYGTVHGQKYDQWLKYSAKGPTMVYREGGLVRLEVALQLLFPDAHKIKAVTSALREHVQYRITDGAGNTVHSRNDNTYPLGYSTFIPDQAADYDPTKLQDYTALFRLIPRVKADTNSPLLRVTHSLVVNIAVEHDGQIQTQDHCPAADQQADLDDGYVSDALSDDCKMHVLSTSQPDIECLADEAAHLSVSDDASTRYELPLNTDISRPELLRANSSSLSQQFTMTPPHSRPTSPSLSRSSSSSSIASIFSLKNRSQDDLVQKLEAKAPLDKVYYQHNKDPCIAVCTLELPLVVTSREHYFDGAHSLPPSYTKTATEAPPGYQQTLDVLPPVPIYRDLSPAPNARPCT